jgi:hypothetical protein
MGAKMLEKRQMKDKETFEKLQSKIEIELNRMTVRKHQIISLELNKFTVFDVFINVLFYIVVQLLLFLLIADMGSFIVFSLFVTILFILRFYLKFSVGIKVSFQISSLESEVELIQDGINSMLKDQRKCYE